MFYVVITHNVLTSNIWASFVFITKTLWFLSKFNLLNHNKCTFNFKTSFGKFMKIECALWNQPSQFYLWNVEIRILNKIPFIIFYIIYMFYSKEIGVCNFNVNLRITKKVPWQSVERFNRFSVLFLICWNYKINTFSCSCSYPFYCFKIKSTRK